MQEKKTAKKREIQENVNPLTEYKQSVTLKMHKAKIFFIK